MVLPDGTEIVAHCPNPGAMTGLAGPDLYCWLEENDDPRRKLNHGWRLVELPGGHWACVDTGQANRIVKEALAAKVLPDLSRYTTIRPEVRYASASRVDFLLTEPGLPDAYIEVKSVTLRREGDLAEFPDSVSARGARHLDDLADMVCAGHRAVMLYLVQRTDCTHVSVAADLDPTYAAAFASAMDAGVEVMCFDCTISPDGITLANRVPFDPPT